MTTNQPTMGGEATRYIFPPESAGSTITPREPRLVPPPPPPPFPQPARPRADDADTAAALAALQRSDEGQAWAISELTAARDAHAARFATLEARPLTKDGFLARLTSRRFLIAAPAAIVLLVGAIYQVFTGNVLPTEVNLGIGTALTTLAGLFIVGDSYQRGEEAKADGEVAKAQAYAAGEVAAARASARR